MNLKNGKVFRSKFFGTGPSSYKKRIYRAAVSQSLRNTALRHDKYLAVVQTCRRRLVVPRVPVSIAVDFMLDLGLKNWHRDPILVLRISLSLSSKGMTINTVAIYY